MYTPLGSAILNRDNKTVKALLQNGADPNEPIRSKEDANTDPFALAFFCSNTEAAEQLLKAGATPWKRYNPYALWTLYHGYSSTSGVLWLVKHGVPHLPNPIEKNIRFSAVRFAADQRETELVHALLDLGAPRSHLVLDMRCQNEKNCISYKHFLLICRESCFAAARTLYGLMRFRLRQRDVAKQTARLVWMTRADPVVWRP